MYAFLPKKILTAVDVIAAEFVKDRKISESDLVYIKKLFKSCKKDISAFKINENYCKATIENSSLTIPNYNEEFKGLGEEATDMSYINYLAINYIEKEILFPKTFFMVDHEYCKFLLLSAVTTLEKIKP